MNKLTVFCAIIICFVSFNRSYSAPPGDANISLTKNEQDKIDKLKNDINSSDREVRSKAAKEIISLYHHKGIKINEAVPSLIEELKSVDWERLTEEQGEYSGDLIYILGEYKDSRAIPSIINSLGYAGGKLVTDSLAKMGPNVLDALISKADDQKNINRKHALFYLGKVPVQMTKYGYSLSAENKDKIKNALTRALNNDNESVRRYAVDAIGDVHVIYDKAEVADIKTKIESIARNDSYKTSKKIDGKEKERYPVREEAQKILQKLKNQNSQR